MKAARSHIAQVVADRSQRGFSKHTAREIAAYLLENGRVADLPSILRDVQAKLAKDGYVEVLARSAHQLDAAAHQEIEAEARKLYPAAKKIVITSVVTPEVVGGVQLTIIDHQLDLTIRGKLQRFKMFAVHGKEQI